MLSADDLLGRHDGPARVSLTAGKGFAPFGTDDPMVRPFVRYPGQSPSGPDPRARGGDRGRCVPARSSPRPGCSTETSRSARSMAAARALRRLVERAAHRTVPPRAGAAGVLRPRALAGAPTRARAPTRPSGVSRRGGSGPVGGQPVYGLVEWARTSEAEGFFVFHSFLAEGAWTRPPSSLVPVRADRAAGGGAGQPVPVAPAAPGELDSRHDPVDGQHAGYELAALRRVRTRRPPTGRGGSRGSRGRRWAVRRRGPLWRKPFLVAFASASGWARGRRCSGWGATERPRTTTMHHHEDMSQ